MYGARKRDPMTLACMSLRVTSMRDVTENRNVYGTKKLVPMTRECVGVGVRFVVARKVSGNTK